MHLRFAAFGIVTSHFFACVRGWGSLNASYKIYLTLYWLSLFFQDDWILASFSVFLHVYGIRLRLSPYTCMQKRTWSISNHLDRTSLVNNPYTCILAGIRWYQFWLSKALVMEEYHIMTWQKRTSSNSIIEVGQFELDLSLLSHQRFVPACRSLILVRVVNSSKDSSSHVR